MKIKKIDEKLFVKLEKGEEVVSGLKAACDEAGVRSGSVSGIGATDKAEIGFYEASSGDYRVKKVTGDHELLSLNGNIAVVDDKAFPHLHIMLGDSEYRVIGGHLVSAVISVTCEIIVDIADGVIERKEDEETGLKLWEV